MTNLVRSEWRKLRSTQTMYWLLGVSLALVALISALTAWQTTKNAGAALAQGASVDWNALLRRDLGGMATTGGNVMLLVLGILVVTTEFRHNTITPTLLGAPRRWQMIASKFVAVTLLSLIFAVSMMVLALAILIIWYKTADASLAFTNGELWLTILGNAAVLVLFGLLGLGIGALVRNQVVAVVVSIVYFLVLQNIFAALAANFSGVAKVYHYLPGTAAAALSRTSFGEGTPVGILPPSMWVGGVVLLAYVLVFCLAGTRFVISRDVT
jgi:ABC-type transport system involved in multi-copper enzyme maturation permease subunit